MNKLEKLVENTSITLKFNWFQNYFYFKCMGVFCMYSMHHRHRDVHRGQQKTFNPLEPELQTVICCRVRASTWTCVLWKNGAISPVPGITFFLKFWRCGVKKMKGECASCLWTHVHTALINKGCDHNVRRLTALAWTVLWEGRQSNILATFSLARAHKWESIPP